MDHLSQHPVGNLRDICPMADAVWFYLVASYSLSRACSVYLPCWLLLASKSVCISHSASTSPTVFRNRSYAVCNSSLLLSLYANDLGGNRCGTDVYLPGVRHVVLGVILERTFSFTKGLSVGGMLIGSALVSGIVGGASFHGWGIAIGILSGITYGCYSLLTKTALKKGYSPLSPVLYGSLLMGILALPTIEGGVTVNVVAQNPSVVLLLLLGLGIVTFVLPFFLYGKGLQGLSAGTASTLSIIEPMAATLLSVVVLHDSLGIPQVIGIVLILLSVVLLGKADK